MDNRLKLEGLRKTIEEGREPPKVVLHPSLEIILLEEIRKRYNKEIDPETWASFLKEGDETGGLSSDFLYETDRIVNEILEQYIEEGKIQRADTHSIGKWKEQLWDRSQAFWAELAEPIQNNLDFIGRLIKNAEIEITKMYPKSSEAFGEKAHAMLVDLEYQYSLYRYSRLYKPDLVDLRKMINISGQIVEEIFYHRKIFSTEKNVGEIARMLSSFKRGASPEKTEFYATSMKSHLLMEQNFLDNLKAVSRLRNDYSHGASADQNIDDAFRQCITSLITPKQGVLSVLYKYCATDTKN